MQGFGLGGVIGSHGLVLDLIGFVLFLVLVLLSSAILLKHQARARDRRNGTGLRGGLRITAAAARHEHEAGPKPLRGFSPNCSSDTATRGATEAVEAASCRAAGIKPEMLVAE